MPSYYLQSASDYSTFGIVPVADVAFVGASSGIGSGVGNEPLYFVNSEINSPSNTNWVSGNRVGAGSLLSGDGTAGGGLSEAVMDFKVRTRSAPGGSTWWMTHIGDNSAPTTVGYFACFFQAFSFHIAIGLRNGLHGAAVFTSPHPVWLAVTGGLWQHLRLEVKQTISGVYNPATDIKVYLNGVLESPTFSGGQIGYWDGTNQTHYLALGGVDNNNCGDFSIGDFFVSSNSLDVPSPPNTAPTGSYNSVVQRP